MYKMLPQDIPVEEVSGFHWDRNMRSFCMTTQQHRKWIDFNRSDLFGGKTTGKTPDLLYRAAGCTAIFSV